jgi:uncharacterized tellurite resistance protein B-like protein
MPNKRSAPKKTKRPVKAKKPALKARALKAKPAKKAAPAKPSKLVPRPSGFTAALASWNPPRLDALQKVRSERNGAFFDAMVLAAIADGDVSELEKQALFARVIERPEFEGMRGEDLTALIESSIYRLSHTRQMEAVLESLRRRLPEHRERLVAFGLAAAIALADQSASREELGLLKRLQLGLGISEEEVAKVFETIEDGHSLAEALGEPKERLFAEVMVLASTADGRLEQAGADAMVETLAGDPVFGEVDAATAQSYLRDAYKNLLLEGMSGRLSVLAAGLTTHKQRLKAFSLAARVADAANVVPSRRTRHVLELLQATFGLADDEVAKAHLSA